VFIRVNPRPKENAMNNPISLHVNGQTHHLTLDPETPLLFILRNELGLKGVKYGCGSEQCGACKVLIDGQAVPTCKLPVKNVVGMEIITIEGLGTPEKLHPIQEAFIVEQALQCGYCTTGMITAAQGLLNQIRYPTDEEIRTGMAENLCRCGVHERVRRAIKLRVGRLDGAPIYEVVEDESSIHPPPAPGRTVELPSSILRNPALDAWIRINPDGTISVFTGKVEFGQGIKTALAQIAADELDVSLERIRMETVDSGYSPNEGLTVGSMSLETSGNSIRIAAAEARYILLTIAFEELEASLERLVVTDGTITDPVSGRTTTYWNLFGGQRFGHQIKGWGQPKLTGDYTQIGQPVPRLDLTEKVTGTPVYVHDLDFPGLVHARVIRPPHYAARLEKIDLSAVQEMPGVVEIIQDGRFLAVVAETEIQVVTAAEKLQTSVTWAGQLDIPPQSEIYAHLLSQPAKSYLIVDGTSTDDPIPAPKTPPSTKTLSATYYRPYQMHASLAPSAAGAQYEAGKLTVWGHSQGVYPIRSALAPVLGLNEADIRVIQTEGSGCYGHNGADDAALDAALIARKMEGVPVSVKWTQADEHTWEPYGPAMIMKMQASLSSEGEVIAWNHDIWSYPHLGRPRPGDPTSDLIAAWHLAEPFEKTKRLPMHASHIGAHRNADPLYAFANKRIVKHFVQNSPLRTSAMRGLGAYANVFAIESFIDELAHAAGIDPVEFRLRNLQDDGAQGARAKAVIRAVAEKAGWQPQYELGENRGRGIAFAQYKNRQCYAAVVIELHVDTQTGAIQLERAVIAADAGQIVNPDGLSNQLEGGFVQAASWTLLEQVDFDETGIQSRDWDSYPILRFPDIPKIEVVLIDRPEMPFLGAGEATQGPTPAAIANAVYAAVGVRLREIPFVPERVLAAINSPSP